jgi:hypothetical protein
MRNTKLNSKRKSGFERLEARSMMAGNVAASVDQFGYLSLIGTDKDNFILVTKNSDNSVKVQGVPGTNTKINGHSSRTFEGVFGGLYADLKKGNDGIAILKGTFFGEVDIHTGKGIDGVLILKTNAPALNIETGADIDVVVLAGVNIFNQSTETTTLAAQVEAGGINIDTGGGKDFVLMAKVAAATIYVNTGSDTDAVGLLGVFSENLAVNMGSGNMDILAIAKSGARFANLDGGGNAADIHVYARNTFEDQTVDGFQIKQSFDAYVDQIENFIKLAQPYLKQLPSIKSLPAFTL